jgi:hypothetical protein
MAIDTPESRRCGALALRSASCGLSVTLVVVVDARMQPHGGTQVLPTPSGDHSNELGRHWSRWERTVHSLVAWC